MSRWIYLLLCVLAFGVGTGLHAQDEIDFNPSTNDDPIQIELIAEDESIQLNHPFWVAIKMSIDPDWHTYWKNPGETGAPVSINWELPPGFEVLSVEWPFPHRFESNSMIGFGYENEVYFLAKLLPSQAGSTEKTLKATLKWIVCSDSQCVPGEKTVSTQLVEKTQAPVSNAAHQSAFKQARTKLPIKMQNIQAERKDNLLRFTLPSDSLEKNSTLQAYFCPDVDSSIDHHSKTLVTLDPQTSSFTVTLQETDENTSPERLKGVLVMDSEEPLAMAIDAPIQNAAPRDPILGASAETQPIPDFDGGFGAALLLAFIGGMILNLMPCVLPVISLKILSFVKMAGKDRTLIFKHGLFFSIGVILSFWTLAGVLLSLRAYGETVGWGFQLQEPIFVAILAGIILLLSLSLFGVFEVGMAVTAWAGQASQTSRKGLASSLLSGVLATAVATPCTGPFLGSAVGFAVTLSAPMALLIFTALGAGMAFPYFLLSAFPKMLRYLPKPGNWMIAFKQLMGFFMLATVLWLVWVFSAQTSPISVFLLLISFFLMALASWIYGTWCTPVKTSLVRWTGTTFALLVLGIGIYSLVTAASIPSEMAPRDPSSGIIAAGEWEDFSPERVAELRKKGIPVLIDFTAKWCLICQTNHLVLTSNSVEDRLNELGVVRMKADWTKNDPVITEELKKFGRNSVPLYVLYGSDEKMTPEILPQVLTPDSVLDALKKIEKTETANAD